MWTPAFDSFDKETLIRFLGDVIEAEVGKPDDEINLPLIEECEGFLSELLSDVTVSDEQMQRNIAKIKGMGAPRAVASARPRRTLRPRRLVAAILAAVLLIGGSLTACTFVPALRDMIRWVLNLGCGETVDDGGVTYVYNGERKKYKNIEEWVTTENLDILYPHKLPDGLAVRNIIASGNGDDMMYNIAFDDGITGIVISCDTGKLPTISDKSEKLVNPQGIITYILTRGELIVSTTVHDGWTYYVTAATMDDLKIIFDNLY